MSVQGPERRAVVAFAPKKDRPDATVVADDAGLAILTLLQKAADMAKEDCARAMDLAHKLSFQLRAAEEKAREFGEQAAHFRQHPQTPLRASLYEPRAIQGSPRPATCVKNAA